MSERSVFTTEVVKDIGNPNRFRWNIYENKSVRDKSFYSFATRREAQSDADKFVRKPTRFGLPQKNKKSLAIQDAPRIVANSKPEDDWQDCRPSRSAAA